MSTINWHVSELDIVTNMKRGLQHATIFTGSNAVSTFT